MCECGCLLPSLGAARLPALLRLPAAVRSALHGAARLPAWGWDDALVKFWSPGSNLVANFETLTPSIGVVGAVMLRKINMTVDPRGYP